MIVTVKSLYLRYSAFTDIMRYRIEVNAEEGMTNENIWNGQQKYAKSFAWIRQSNLQKKIILNFRHLNQSTIFK